MLDQRLDDLFMGDIHDVGGLVGVGFLALLAQLLGDHHALEKRAGQEGLLPGRVADLLAELHIGRVARAEGVAVEEHHALAVKIDHGGVSDQLAATAAGELVTEQEIAIAVHEVDAGAFFAESLEHLGHLVGGRTVVIIPNPGFEHVAQEIDRIGILGVFEQDAHQTIHDRPFVGLDVQVRQEQRFGAGFPVLHFRHNNPVMSYLSSG